MSTRRSRTILAFGLAALVAGVAVTAAQTAVQSPLAPFGVGEAAMRKIMLDTIAGGGTLSETSGFVTIIHRGYDRIPVAARAAATTAAFAWAKAYVNSAAFTTAYATFREEHKPAGAAADTSSIDAAVKKEIDAAVKLLEDSKQKVAALPPADRAKALAGIDDMIANFSKPEYANGLRQNLERTRAETTEKNTKAAADWNTNWPADPKVYVKKHLERFMAATANIDYTLPQIFIKSPRGETVGFLSPGLADFPWESTQAILAGKEAVDAARAAVAAWLKELP